MIYLDNIFTVLTALIFILNIDFSNILFHFTLELKFYN